MSDTTNTKDLRLIPAQYGDADCVLLLTKNGEEGKVVATLYDAATKKVLTVINKTPFPDGCDLSGVKYVQSFDVIFFVEPNTYPCKFIRDNDDTGTGYVWSFANCDIMPEPLLDWNYKSEHQLSCFVLPDEDVKVQGTNDSGTYSYYPAGTVRKGTSDTSSLYVAKIDAPVEQLVTNTKYYSSYTGATGIKCALQVDGTNTNKNLAAGMVLALKTKARLEYDADLNYDDMPVGTSYPTANPSFEMDEKLPSLKSQNGSSEELRPDSGGGAGWYSPWLPVRGKVTIKTNGKWSGVIRMQELSETGNLTEIAKIESNNAASNTELSRDITSFGSAIRLICTRREKAYYLLSSLGGSNGDTIYEKRLKQDSGCQIQLVSAAERIVYLRLLEKKRLTSGKLVWVCECLSGFFGDFETDKYAFGAWSEENGYPRHIAIFQERMVYAGNLAKPMTVWLSKTNDWGDFELGTDDSSAMSFTMYSEKYDEIAWMKQTRSAISIGTQHGEYTFGDANGGVVKSTNARFLNTSNVGGENIPSVVLGDAMFIVKKGGTEVHTVAYNTLTEESAGTQVSMLAKHLFEDDRIVDMFATKSPTNTVYLLCKSGKMVSLTYEPVFNVEGWARHEILDGLVAGTTVRRNGTDVLILVAKKDGKYILGELDPTEENIWTDDGVNYESVLEPTPLVSDNYEGGVYGHRTIFAGADLYVDEGERFWVKLYGGDEMRVDLGFNSQNKLKKFEREKKIELNANTAWQDEAGMVIRTDYPAPLTVTAVGARVKHA